MVNGGEGAGLRNRNGLHYLGGDSEVQNMVRRYVDTYDATPSPSIASPRPPMGAIRGGIAPPRVVSMKDESGNKVKLGTRFRSRLSCPANGVFAADFPVCCADLRGLQGARSRLGICQPRDIFVSEVFLRGFSEKSVDSHGCCIAGVLDITVDLACA